MAPIVSVGIAAAATPPSEDTSRVIAQTGTSLALAAGVAAAAVVLGWVPGRLLGTAERGRTLLLLLMLMPLLLPRYVLYYAWSLLLSPTTALGRLLSQRAETAQWAAAITSTAVVVLWYWPLAALLIAAGWRDLDVDALDAASLDAGAIRRFRKVTLRMLARPIGLALAVCGALAMSEFGTFHLAGIRTVGTELAVLYDLTGSEGVVARAAWPMMLAAVLVAIALWRRTRTWTTRPPSGRVESAHNGRRWALLGALVAVSLAAPLAVLVGNLNTLRPLRLFWNLHRDKLAWSLMTASGAAATAMAVAWAALSVERFGRGGRWLGALVQATIFLAMFLPGSIVAMALLRLVTALGGPHALRQGWPLVAAGQAARFAGLGLILLRFARDAADKPLGEMAAVDGASPAAAWRHVHWPRHWPLPVGAFVLLVLFAMTELPATMVLLPAGLPSFAQWLLNQMHYVRDQHVIIACLVLTGVYLAAGAVAVVMVRLTRLRSAAAAILCAVLLLAGGCEAAPSSDAEVVGHFGRTGRGDGEFIYPRAIDIAADGTIFVVDKTGRIQRFSGDGEFLGAFRTPQTERGYPTGISISPEGDLYAADTHYHQVLVYAPDGRLLRRFGRFGEADGCFIYPTDVAFAPDGRIFVSEYGGNDRISVFTSRGEFLFSFGSPGEGPGQFDRPSAVCVDNGRGLLYVADACNHRIAVYNLDGKLLRYIGSAGSQAGQLRYPYDLALTPDGALAVCEYGNNRVQLFAADGRSLQVLGGPGRPLGRLAYPWALAADARGRLYVVDAGNNRVQVWQL